MCAQFVGVFNVVFVFLLKKCFRIRGLLVLVVLF